MQIPSSGETPKLGCMPMLIALFVVVVLLGVGWLWLLREVMAQTATP